MITQIKEKKQRNYNGDAEQKETQRPSRNKEMLFNKHVTEKNK